METPNTRARRKRELREIEERGSGVSWQSDEQLRNEFLMQSAAESIPLPPPTQRPASIGSSSFSGERPASKRPRRMVRGTQSLSTPRSAPSTERNRLDELLDRYLDLSSRPSSTVSTPQSGSSSMRTNTASTSTSRSTQSTASVGSTSSRTLADRTNAARVMGATRSLPSAKGGAPELRATKSAPQPIAQLAAERPVRSSPRRSIPAPPIAASPLALRGLAAPLEARSGARPSAATSSRQHLPAHPCAALPHPRLSSTPTRASSPRTTRSVAVHQPVTKPLPPQPSSDGDTSIDSLDMAFECGGDDIDALFQVMDGRK